MEYVAIQVFEGDGIDHQWEQRWIGFSFGENVSFGFGGGDGYNFGETDGYGNGCGGGHGDSNCGDGKGGGGNTCNSYEGNGRGCAGTYGDGYSRGDGKGVNPSKIEQPGQQE